MKKKRKLTALEKKLNAIRAANRREGWFAARSHFARLYADELAGLEGKFRNQDSFAREEFNRGRAAGYESGFIAGAKNALPSDRSAWEQICDSDFLFFAIPVTGEPAQ